MTVYLYTKDNKVVIYSTSKQLLEGLEEHEIEADSVNEAVTSFKTELGIVEN